jgi:hypothetical protein
VSKDAPGNAGELVGERDGEDVVMQPFLGCFEPRLEPVTMPTLWLDQHNSRGLNEQNAEVRFDILPRMVRSPVEICLGTSPSQAAKSRPLVNASLVPIAAAIALEMIGPIPGTLTCIRSITMRRART